MTSGISRRWKRVENQPLSERVTSRKPNGYPITHAVSTMRKSRYAVMRFKWRWPVKVATIDGHSEIVRSSLAACLMHPRPSSPGGTGASGRIQVWRQSMIGTPSLTASALADLSRSSCWPVHSPAPNVFVSPRKTFARATLSVGDSWSTARTSGVPKAFLNASKHQVCASQS